MRFPRIPFIYILAFLYFVLSFGLMYVKWRGHVPSLDYHAYLQMYWNTANGDILMYNRASESQYSMFSAHFAPILLMFFPVYALIKHQLALYAVYILCISLSIVPLYYFALEKLHSKFTAYLLAVSFLLYFPFLWTHRHGFAEEAFATPFLFFAFYFLDKKRSWLYFVFSFLTLSLRINMALPVLLLALYGIWKNKARSQAVFVALLSIFWPLYIINIIYPKYADPNIRYYVYGFFGDYGNNPKEVITTMITKPHLVWTSFISKTKLLVDLFGPVLFLPILGIEILALGLPIIFITMIASYPRLSSSWTYYHASSLPFIWLGLVLALERLGKLWDWIFKKNVRKSIFINLLVIAILITNIVIDQQTANGQYLPFSKWFETRKYEINERDAFADTILFSIPETNSIASQHSYLEHTAERKWQFPTSNFNGYSPDIVLLDTWASSYEFKTVPKEDPYTKIFEKSFFYLYSRNDLIRTYKPQDFIDSDYKNYDPEFEYMAVVKSSQTHVQYSGIKPEIPVDINENYQLSQKLDIQEESPQTIEIPLEKSNLLGSNDLYNFGKNTVGDLKIEIREGTNFKSDYKVIYTTTYKPEQLTHKTNVIELDLEGTKIDITKTYWLIFSLNQKRQNPMELFNSYRVYLVTKTPEFLNSSTKLDLQYSLNGGEIWQENPYPEKNLTYSITYGKPDALYIGKGTPDNIKATVSKLVESSQDYDSLIIVGTVTEKL